MASITFTVKGQILPKQRPFFGKGRVFTPKATVQQEKTIGWLAKEAMRGAPLMIGPVSLEVEVILTPPQSWPKKKREAARYSTNAKDLSNTIKAIEDGMNEIVYKDDCQIAMISASKRYSLEREECVRITVRDLTQAPFAR